MGRSRSLFLLFFYLTSGLALADRAVASDPLDLLGEGHALLQRGDDAAAESLLRAAAEQAAKDGADDIRAGAANALGVALRRQGRYLEAEAAFVGSLTLLEGLGPGRRTAIGAAYANLGLTRVSLHKPTQALEALERAVAMLTEQGEQVSAAAALTSLGRLHHQQRRWADAGEAYGRALELYLAAGATGPEAALCRNGLGAAAFDAGRRREAVAYFEDAVAGFGDSPRFTPVRASALANLGRAALAARELDRADNLFRQALALQEESLGPRHPDIAVTLAFQAEAAAARGEKRQSKALMRRARDIRALAYEANGGGATVDVSAWMERER